MKISPCDCYVAFESSLFFANRNFQTEFNDSLKKRVGAFHRVKGLAPVIAKATKEDSACANRHFDNLQSPSAKDLVRLQTLRAMMDSVWQNPTAKSLSSFNIQGNDNEDVSNSIQSSRDAFFIANTFYTGDNREVRDKSSAQESSKAIEIRQVLACTGENQVGRLLIESERALRDLAAFCGNIEARYIRSLPDGVNKFISEKVNPIVENQSGKENENSSTSTNKTFFASDHLNQEFSCNGDGPAAMAAKSALASDQINKGYFEKNILIADLNLKGIPTSSSPECRTIANRYSFLLGFITNEGKLRLLTSSERNLIYEGIEKEHSVNSSPTKR